MNAGLLRWQAERRADAAESARLHAEAVEQFGALWAAQRREDERAAKRARAAARQAAKMQRLPAWADRRAIAQVYAEARRLTRETGVEHHVDHDIPLRGALVSGLHVHTNLRPVPAAANLAKGNRFTP